MIYPILLEIYKADNEPTVCRTYNNSTFLTKEQLLELVDSIINDYANDENVVNLNKAAQIAAERDIIEQRKPFNSKRQPKMGYIYIFSAKNLFKIGTSKDVNKRLRAINAASGYNITLLCKYKVDDAYITERYLHNKYSSKRHHGEWFNLSESDIIDIEQYLKTVSK